MATELCWWPLSAWISPGAASFLLFNVLVVAVAVTSRAQQGISGASSRRRLCRSASSMVLDRLRSFSMFSIHPAAECYDHTAPEAEEPQVAMTAHEQAVLELAAAEPQSSPAATPATDAAASMPERRMEEAEVEEKSARLDETNVKVQGKQHHAPKLSSPPDAAAAAATAAVEAVGKKKPETKVAPASSKRRARARGRREAEETEGKAELNARADLFIRQFRDDLKLQRLNSIINYTTRSAAATPAQHQPRISSTPQPRRSMVLCAHV